MFFRDMHAERDHLVRFVFPELKERCRKLRVQLVDVDLRWGVSEQDANAGKALDIRLFDPVSGILKHHNLLLPELLATVCSTGFPFAIH